MMAYWWQCGCTNNLLSSWGGSQSSVVSSSATVLTCLDTACAAGSLGRSSTRSERNVAVQLGSRPTIVYPSSTYGASTSTVLVSFCLAAVSWPVVTRVRPQQMPGSAIVTSQPAASSTVMASRAISGDKLSVDESTHSTTFVASGWGLGPRVLRSRRSGFVASSG